MDRTLLSKERKRYCVNCQQQDSKILCFSLEKFLGAKDIRGTLQNPTGNVLDSLDPAVVPRGFYVQSHRQCLPTLSSGDQTHGAAAPSCGPPGSPRPSRSSSGPYPPFWPAQTTASYTSQTLWRSPQSRLRVPPCQRLPWARTHLPKPLVVFRDLWSLFHRRQASSGP